MMQTPGTPYLYGRRMIGADGTAGTTPGNLHEEILVQIADLEERALSLSAQSHGEPETSFQGHRAASLLTEWLEKPCIHPYVRVAPARAA
jgi:hypothetical protein